MTFTLAGQTYTPTQVVQLATSLLAADNATVLAKAAYAEAVAAEKKLLATDGKVVQQLRESLALIFSNSPTTLADLQIAPRKTPKPLSTQVRAARGAKAEATRRARGTTSKKQKAAIILCEQLFELRAVA